MVNRVKAVLFRKSTSALLVLAATAIASGAMIVSASTTISQIGSDIDGEAAGDYSGFSVSLSSDGTAVAIGAHLNDGNGADSGHVRVYEWNGNAWIQKGADIDGEAEGDYSGFSVSLSSDGTVVAVGAQRNGAYSGHVRVYGWNENAWQQKGADIDGEAEGDESGRSVSLSSDGTKVAIGAPYNNGSAGHVRVYEWNENAWVQRGADIDGEAGGDRSGQRVSLSSDGTKVAIGAPYNDGTGISAGHVRVYEWNENAWQQKGADIDGEAEGDRSGRSVSLSSDGTRVAVGADINSETGVDAGHVRVYSITTSTPTTTTTAPLTTEAPTTTTVVLPATGLSNGAAPQVLLVLGVGGLLVLFTRHRPSVRD